MNGEGQYLVVRRGGADGERVPLNPDVPGTIGRSRDNAVVLTDASVSRRHARVWFRDGAWWVEDLGSKNGTKVNGSRIEAASRLTAGDVLSLGNFQLIFSATGSQVTARVADVAGPATLKSLKVEEFETGSDTRSFGAGLSPERVGNFLRAVDKVGQALLAHRSVDELFTFVVELASDVLRADRTALLLRDPLTGELVARAVKLGTGFEGAEIVVSRSIAKAAMEQKQALLTGDAQSDSRFRAQLSVIQQRIHSAMCAPLWHDDQVLGLIYVDNVAAPAPFEESDLRLLTLIAHLTAVKVRETEQYEAVERAERLAVELRRAATLQQNLLPPEPLRHGRVLVAGRNIPSFDVGGDYFDFIPSEDGRLVVALGDVAGKGMGAALLMAHLHATVRAQVETGRALRDVMGRLNRSIHQSVRGLRFITLFLAQMDTERGAVTYVNGGHNPPLLVRASGEVEPLTEGGPLLGIFPEAVYEEGTAALEPGDLLVAYSDGVTEARGPAGPGEEAGEELGEEHLVELLRSSRGLGPEELVERLIARVREFTGIAQQADDVTVAVIRFGS